MTSSPGKTRLSTIGLMLLATMAWLLPQWTDASSVIRSFQQRYQLTGRADSAVIGNHLLNCPTSSACTTARNGTGNNNNYTMGQVDIDGQAGTFNSSMAPLSIPVGSTVQRAYLYWGADTSAGGSGSAAPTPASRNQVRFSAAGGAYVTVTASTVDVSGNRYSAVADVTSLVASAGSGNYMTANVQAGTGSDRYAGWSLVVIYSNPTLPLRSLTLFDGSLNINSSAPTSITTNVSGFRTPATGAVDARIGLVAFEGDNASTGDQFLVNGTAISDALNPNNNIFNSTNSRLGVAQTGRNPQQSNMFGFDIDYIPVPAGVIVNNATSASLTFNTGGETYFPAALLFQTNVYEPEIVTNFSKAATDLNGGQFRPGDVLEYTIALSNTGDDAADQTVISDPLPLGLTYVPGSIEVVTGANAGAKTDAAGDDQAEYNAGTRTITVRVGTGANASTGGRIAPVPQASSSTSVRFRAQIDLVQPNGASLSNIAGVSYVGATSGTNSSGNTPPSTVTVSRDADLAITKAGPASVVAGAPIQYTLTVSSLGPDAADGATVTDNVPAGITNVSITCAASGGATCPSTTGLTTLSAVALPAMPSGGEVVFTISGTAPMAGNTLSNTASVAVPSGTNDPTPGNNSAGPVTTTVDAGLDLAVTGALTTAGTIRTGDAVAYQFTVTNNGPIAAPGAPFTLPMPTGLAGATWTCAPVARCGVASGTGDISLSLTLAVGENVTIDFVGTAPTTTPATLGDAVGTVAAPTGLGDSNPANNIATVPAVVVQAREITAGADSGSVVNGSVGGTAVANVLANDTLDGAPATLATVSLAQVSTTHPNITLNPATGAIEVAAGTPAGTYTVTYQICELANPGNCDTASVTVTVGAAVIDAVDDDVTGAPVNGASGGDTVSVLANDTLDGAAVTVGVGGNVTLTPGAAPTPAAGGITMNADGTITVSAGTTAGVYTYSYTVCEVLNPTNCDTATVTLVVDAAVIDAVADTGTVANGAAGGTAVANVLVNDTLNGAPATLASVTLSQLATTNPNVTLDVATGAVNVAPGTPAGTYTVTYEVCEILNPSNCDVAQVTVTVGAAPIDAVADTGTVANGAAGGTAVPNVLANDTLNGVPATLANVVVTQSATTNPNVTLNPATGAVNVAPGTPAGTYTVTYQICEQLNPTNCDSSTVTVTVGAAVIDAVDDDVTGTPVNGASGGTLASVLANDTLDGAAATVGVGGNVTLTPGAAPTPAAGSITMNADGTITVAPGTTAGAYTYAYTVCEVLNPTNCDTASVLIVVNAPQLTMGKTASAASFTVGVPASYTLQVTNTGTAATTASATVTDTIPAGLAIGVLPAGCTAAGQTVTCTIPAGLSVGSSTGFVVPVTPTAAAGVSVTNTATVSGGGDPTCPAAARCTSTAGPTPVEPVAIVAVDDTGVVANGASGGTAVANVLANDTLDGAPATLASVTLSQLATTNPNVTLDVATGAVNVAPGTPAGTYTMTYEVCEILNPSNCDVAQVTVTVGAAPIDAMADTGTMANGAAGGTAVPNVLVNDTLNGVPATLANVVVTQSATTNPNVTLNPATGAVNVAPGTPAGTYTVTYQICEQLNPTNCDSSTVTVTVGAAVIDAVDDDVTGAPVNGASGGTTVSVLANDTLDGAAVTVGVGGNVTLTPGAAPTPAAGSITMNADGTITVSAGTTAGVYTYSYTVCEVLNPTNCDTATVTLVVDAAVIDAVADTGTVANGASGGTAVANVLVNDTLNGAPATLANATLTQVSTTNPNVTLDVATGAVNVAAGTPAGTYTVTYQICEQLNPTNCDSATVTVTVGAAVIDAANDTGTVASGASGGAAVANVLVNDTLNGAPATLANATLTQVSTTNPNVTLDVATGAVNVAAGTPAGTYTVTYQICEQLNPTNCDTATVTVTVGAAVIDAVDDTGTLANGASGGTAVANVLVNDTLNGAPATLATVTLTQISTTNPNVTLDVATGAVNVAAGTPAGTYTVTYQICEQLNPTNCDTATVTVTVGAAVVDAVDDTGTVANGASGGTAVANVLVNDTLNGAPATLANVTLTQVSTTNPNVTLDVATGAVNVAAGTPAGTYTVTYQICEQLNPTNCDTATVTVTVGAAVIDAVDDTGTLANGASGGTAVANVLVNDTLNGAPATLATVTLTQISTTNPNVTLNPATGAVSVAPGTPAGTYTVTYQICEQLNPTNCDTATVTVTVGAAVVDAVDDTGTLANGASGGTAVPNVLVNDTLNGAPATLATVTLAQISTTNPNVTLDPATGAVNVAAGTPAGTYTVTYQICEQLNPTNCDTATVTVTVGAAVIDAVDDTGTVANGASGGTAVANVLVNDTLNGAAASLANVTLTQVSTTNPNVTLDVATGAVNVAPGTPAGTYTVIYQICEQLNPTNCDTAVATVTVGAAVIDAVDDSGTVANGAAGGVGVANVLVNDTLGGAPATLANVTLAQVATTNPNVTLDPATGAVNVAAGTPAGTYTVTYQICEVLNPGNCDTAVATLTVGAAPIDAIDDTGSLSTTAGGVAVANVLANDSLDGSAATLANVSLAQVSTTDPNVTLDPATGAVSVAPGTPAGTYLVTYQICELLNPTNCDTAIATVTVVAPAVAAVDDAGSTTQNTAIGIAVLGNDSFGGAAATTTDVTVEFIGLPVNGSAVVNADGSITYTPSANYSGPDQLRYRICGVVNPGVCAEAVVDIVVAPNTVTAPDDSRVTAQATPVSVPLMAMAGTGGGAPLDPASLQIVAAPANGSVVVNADGTATYTPDTLFFGTDSFQYRVCDQSVPMPVCAVGTITVTVEMAAPQLRISKTTPATTVRVGDFVRYSITVENIGIAPAGNVTLLDVPPTGFTYVEGSLLVDDADGVHGLAGTQPLRITGVDIPVGGTATVGYLLRVGAGTGPGLHTNTVSATDALGNTVSNVAQADVLVEGDPLLEDSLVLGTVFLDLDGDGRQQAGEPGLAGVRLATVEGLVVETDVHGRFHLLGLEGGNSLRGRNAIVKVDVATLPPGSRFTTPNPLVRRITPGLPVRFDFGVQLPGEGSDTAPGKR